MIKLSTYITQSGEVLLYNGAPDLEILEELSMGSGDLWHSSLDQGFENCFQELVYHSAVYWWFINDFKGVDTCVSWRMNVHNFVVRASVWEVLGGFDNQYSNDIISGLDFGFNLIRNSGGVPLYVKGLFPKEVVNVSISKEDRYLFFLKNFKKHHSYYMLFRKCFSFFSEYKTLKNASKKVSKEKNKILSYRDLKPIKGNPTVSLVIPTMKRQEYTELLLQDHNTQSYLIKEAIIVDATPEEERDAKYYNPENFKFNVIVKWQTTKGSCRARNEAINMCSGNYIIFADDDVRVLPDFVENHIRLLQTYNVSACNGLDIMADNTNQNLNDLKEKLSTLNHDRWKVGVAHLFSNANACVKRTVVEKLVGNDVNFDGGYGEDADFGLRILKLGEVLLHNPFSPNLHLKPPVGGYRFWGNQSKILGKNRKIQPWELDKPVKNIRPVPSPTITYKFLKHYTSTQIKEWRWKHFFIYLFKREKKEIILRLLKLPYKYLQFSKSLMYAKRLIKKGEQFK
ncbi:glycosyltransferase family 2 protein [uncultured Algibacter sp.]|uniref:glycosyltransferase family 2 protein n=1 Tax=uncultured Algibacter sp. TaxID=298659 RepID=UPI00260286BD|nr:glycosyltransferase family 2 protein [uncultured Algibacter sp.]